MVHPNGRIKCEANGGVRYDYGMDKQSEPDEKIDIEAIMQQIRQQILETKQAAGHETAPSIPVQGKRLPAEFYEHLYYAGMTYDQIGVKMNVTAVPIPIIGKVIEAVRTKIHELVLFYLNQTAAQQIKVNHHLLQALSILSEQLEEEAE